MNSTAFWTEAEFNGPAGWIVTCSCGYRTKAPDDKTADRILEQHTLAHEAIGANGRRTADGYGTDNVPGGWGGAA